MNSPTRVAIVTNVPAPYRVPVFNRVARMPDIELQVIYCAAPHIDPTLDASAHEFPTHFLQGKYWAMETRFMHADPKILSLLSRLKPDVVVTTGYIPTFLLAFGWARARGVPHVVLTDGTMQSEQQLSALHRHIRRHVFKHSAAFAGACNGSLQLFRSYGVPESKLHVSALCVDNARFDLPPAEELGDFIFCGRLVRVKQPLFAMDVAARVADMMGRRVTIDFVGSGAMADEIRAYSQRLADRVTVRMRGYVSQADLPACYAAARIFLFPSQWDVWGLVANEACAAGLPVIVSPHAGVAGELVQDGYNGFIRALDVQAWADAACALLRDQELYAQFSLHAREAVSAYTFEASAQGLADAIRQAKQTNRHSLARVGSSSQPEARLSANASASPGQSRREWRTLRREYWCA